MKKRNHKLDSFQANFELEDEISDQQDDSQQGLDVCISTVNMPREFASEFEQEWGKKEGVTLKKDKKYSKREKMYSSEDALMHLIRDISHTPLLTKDGEVALFKLIEEGRLSEVDSKEFWHGVWAREKVMLSNMRLVVNLAKRCFIPGITAPLIDMIQDGTIGLERAVKKFDWTKGFKFSTYATWWIRQAIGRYGATDDTTIKIPAQKREAIKRVALAQIKLEGQGVEITPELIAEITGMKRSEVVSALSTKQLSTVFSLDKSIDGSQNSTDSATTFVDVIGEVDHQLEAVEDRICVDGLMKVLEKLDSKYREVLERRLGLNGQESQTLEEIGTALGITKEAVRQLEKKSLEKLRSFDEIMALKVTDL